MANREENLEKINAELEMLTDEQLEQVAGGYKCPIDLIKRNARRKLQREEREKAERERKLEAELENFEFYKAFMPRFQYEKALSDLKKEVDTVPDIECYPAADMLKPKGPLSPVPLDD